MSVRANQGVEELARDGTGRAVALAARIEAEICDGGIPAGTRLGTKRDLCARYRVAYGTLNEAIRVLQHRGFVETMGGPRGGLFASSPAAHVRLRYMNLGYDRGGTFEECAAVRFALDEAVAVDAAGSRSEADVEALERLLHEMERTVDEPDAYLHANWAFHRRMAECCANTVLRNLYCTLLDTNEAQLREVVPAPAFQRTVMANLASHAAIVAAIRAGSPRRAKAAVARHAASRDRGGAPHPSAGVPHGSANVAQTAPRTRSGRRRSYVRSSDEKS